jgi:predicted nucleic acid-binding protein
LIVVDTSVWADHFRSADHRLAVLWMDGAILQHPLVTGELAMGNLRGWESVVRQLQHLPQAVHLPEVQVMTFIREHRLMGSGLGLIDAHILASAASAPGISLWTRDRRLAAQADRLGIAYSPG